MPALNSAPEKGSNSLTHSEAVNGRVFQPAKLTEIMDMIDLMGEYSERVREDRSHDMGGGSGAMTTQKANSGGGTSPRDAAIAKLPVPPVMQKQLITHIKGEIKKLSGQAHGISHITANRGSAYLLNEIYKRIRRLSTLIDEIISASADMIRRFYIALFIDHQPLRVDEGSFAQSA